MTATTLNLDPKQTAMHSLEGGMNHLLKTMGAVCILALTMTATVFASPRTLIDTRTTELGGFGGPTVHYSTFGTEDALLVGGQGALLVNKSFYIGAGGYGMATRHRAPSAGAGTSDSRFEMGYGGMILGLVHNSDDVVHMSADVMVGAGALVNTYFDDRLVPHYDSDGDWENGRKYDDDPFFVVQPMARIEMNVLSFWRVGFEGGYRFVNGVNSFGMTDHDLSGPVAGVTFRFGKF